MCWISSASLWNSKFLVSLASTLTDQSLRRQRSRGCEREVEHRVPRRRRKFQMPIFAFPWEYPSYMFRWWGKKTGLKWKKGVLYGRLKFRFQIWKHGRLILVQSRPLYTVELINDKAKNGFQGTPVRFVKLSWIRGPVEWGDQLI